MRYFGIFVGAFLGILLFMFLIWGISTGFRYWSAPIKGKVDAREQVQSGQFRIAAYDHFFDLCASVQNAEAALAAQYEELAGTTGDDRERVRANIAGLLATRLSGINQYNVDARKDYTIGQFRSSGLPYQLSTDPYMKGVQTSCTV